MNEYSKIKKKQKSWIEMVDITDTLDCTGDVCPYPDVKSKKKVKNVKPEEIFEFRKYI